MYLDMELKRKIQFYYLDLEILLSEQELFTDLTETEIQIILQNYSRTSETNHSNPALSLQPNGFDL